MIYGPYNLIRASKLFHQSIRCKMDSKIGSHSFVFISLPGKRMSASSLRWDGLQSTCLGRGKKKSRTEQSRENMQKLDCLH